MLFLLRGKLVEKTSLSLLIISTRSLQLLKLSTICKSPLHGPHKYVIDRTWERSANYGARTFLLAIALKKNFGSSSVRWIHSVRSIVADRLYGFIFLDKE